MVHNKVCTSHTQAERFLNECVPGLDMENEVEKQTIIMKGGELNGRSVTVYTAEKQGMRWKGILLSIITLGGALLLSKNVREWVFKGKETFRAMEIKSGDWRKEKQIRSYVKDYFKSQDSDKQMSDLIEEET